jgi:hypothetical protein
MRAPDSAISRRPSLPSRLGALFEFPNPVNEVAARVVAGGVVLMAAAALGFGEPWIFIPLVYGFAARVLTGPKLSPLGQFATRVAAPRIGQPRFVAGPPKRFAQAMGLAFSLSSLILWFGFSEHIAAWVLMAMLLGAASLEAFLGFCVGCRVFALLARAGIIPEEVCAACVDLSLRLR